MQSKLQELTEKLYKDGVSRANEDALQIIEKAKSEADEIIKNANKKAENIIEEAKKTTAEMAKNTESEIKLTSKQAISALKQTITDLLSSNIIGSNVKEPFKDTNYIKNLIEILVKNWRSGDAESNDLLLILPEAEKMNLDKYIGTKLKKLLDGEIMVDFDANLQNGFKIGPADGSYTLSFSDEDFENFFKAYLRPRTAKLLYGEE